MTPAQEHILAVLMADAVPSRTMLQKCVFFVARSRGEDLGYAAYLYGPYSSEVQSAIASLARGQLISEVSSHLIDRTGKDLDGIQYRYELTGAGRALAGQTSVEVQAAARRIVEAAKDRGAFNPTGLSYAAKLAHMQEVQGGELTPEAARTLAKSLGWQLSTEDLERAARFLKAIETIQTTPE